MRLHACSALLAVAVALAAVPALHAQTVILVRHAEKESVPGNDPPLSQAGEARAEALAAALVDAGVSHVIVTSRQRTALTAAIVTRDGHLTPVAVPLGDGDSAHVAAVAAAVRKVPRTDAVLVVGHSNTIPRIIAALGGPTLPDLCDAEYATLFVLELNARPVRLVRTHYGAPDAPDAGSCTNQMENR